MTSPLVSIPRNFTKALSLFCVSCALVACSPSVDSVEKDVKALFQKTLDNQQDLKPLGLVVEKVDVIHESGNRYKGIAIVGMNGQVHQVPMSVTADGNKVMYEVSPGGLDFIAQHAMKQAFQSILEQAPPMPRIEPEPPAEPIEAIPADVRTLTERADYLNDLCRDKPGDDPVGEKACQDLDEVGKLIASKGWCWGHKDDAGYQRRWVKCLEGDV